MKYELIGGPLHGEVRRIDMRIGGKKVTQWKFWTGLNQLSTYGRMSHGGSSARNKTVLPSLLFRGTVEEKMTNDQRGKGW